MSADIKDNARAVGTGPDRQRLTLSVQLFVALGVALAVCVGGWKLALVAAVAAPVALYLLLGPTRPMLAVFLVYMIASHQYISLLIVPLGGIEFHPREFLLFLLLAHCAFKIAQGRMYLRPSPVHAAVAMYASYFALTAAVGVVRQADLHAVVTECRFAMFLLTYVVIVLFATGEDVRSIGRLVVGLTVVIAVASLSYAAYKTLTQTAVQLNQTPFGEIMRYPIGPYLVQEVRPNGHMFFEVGIVVAASLVLGHGVTRRERVLLVLLIGLLGAALAITFMRTAYLATLISLGILALLLPGARYLKAAAVLGGMIVVLAVFIFAGDEAVGLFRERAPNIDLSLQARQVEMRGAWAEFIQHPISGVGMGGTFRGLQLAQAGDQLAAGVVDYQTIHNVWMGFLFKGGLLGFVLVVVGLGGILANLHLTAIAESDPRGTAFLRGVTAAFAGQLVASLAMPRLYYPSGHVFVALIAALIVLWPEVVAMDGRARRAHGIPPA